jgi:voltage-gated potassium channel
MEAKPMTRGHAGHLYLLYILALSCFALVLLAVLAIAPLSADEREVLEIADTVICALFFADFLVSVARAENRRRYLFTWGWLDLLSSVPAVNALRSARFARIVRILRVLRGVRAARVISGIIVERRAQAGMVATGLFTAVVVVVASVAVLQFESAAGGNIVTAEDALWWSVTTMTTVGYGDRFPLTTEGRVVAACLMFCGIGLFGVLSGLMASWFVAPSGEKRDTEIAALRAEVREIRQMLSERTPDANGSENTGRDEP